MKIKNWKLAWTCIRNTRFFFFIPPERFFHLLAQHRSFPSFSSASFNIIGHSWPRSYKKMTEYYDRLLFRQMLSTFATRVEVNRTIFERVKILLQKIIICGTSLHFSKNFLALKVRELIGALITIFYITVKPIKIKTKF